MAHPGEPGQQRRIGAEADAELGAGDGADPGAELQAVAMQAEAIDDRPIGRRIRTLHRRHQVEQHARLTRQLVRGKGEAPGLLDGVDPDQDGSGLPADLTADPAASPGAEDPADDLAMTAKSGLGDDRLGPRAVQRHCDLFDRRERFLVLEDFRHHFRRGAQLADRIEHG